MKHRVRVSAPFSFRGKTFHPEIVLDMERILAEGKGLEDIHPMLAAANGIGGYSYEYEMLEAAPLHFDRPEGLVGEYLVKGRLDLDGLRAALQRQKRLELLAGLARENKRVFDLVKDFGTSESPKSTRSSTTHWCPGRPGHPAFRHNIASSLRLHTGLPYDWTPRSDAPLGSPLAPSARRVSRVASRLPGTTRLRFALHGGQRMKIESLEEIPGLAEALLAAYEAGSRTTPD